MNWEIFRVEVKGNVRFGFIDPETGRSLTVPKFLYATPFEDGTATVFLEDKNGDQVAAYLLPDGSFLGNCFYEDVIPFKFGVGLVKLNGRWGMISKSCSYLVFPAYDKLEWIDEFSLIEATLGGKVGILSKNGKLIHDTVYDGTDCVNDECFTLRTLEGKCAYLKEDGSFLIEDWFDFPAEFIDGIAIVEKNSRIGILSKEGKMILPCEYGIVSTKYVDPLISCRKNNKWGYFNIEKNEWLFTPQFDNAEPFDGDEIARIGIYDDLRGWRYGYIRKDGSYFADPIYLEAAEWEEGDLIRVIREDGLRGHLDKNGTFVPKKKHP